VEPLLAPNQSALTLPASPSNIRLFILLLKIFKTTKKFYCIGPRKKTAPLFVSFCLIISATNYHKQVLTKFNIFLLCCSILKASDKQNNNQTTIGAIFDVLTPKKIEEEMLKLLYTLLHFWSLLTPTYRLVLLIKLRSFH
jgi:hypothetical protein